MRIILAGFGTVGQSLARIISAEHNHIEKAYGLPLQVTSIVDSHGGCLDEGGLDLQLALRVKKKWGTVARYPNAGRSDYETGKIVSTSEADVLVETTPTNFLDGEPGLTNIKKALSAGKHVVTTNKGPLALAMPALLELSKYKNRRLLFSGTVGAGTPFLDIGRTSLQGEKINGFRGVLNATTNYILTRMEEASLSLAGALNEAKSKGFAEADSSYDLEGLDTAAKVVILSNWVTGSKISLRHVRVDGISGISSRSLRKAIASGKRLRLVGKLQDGQGSAGLEEVRSNNPLCVYGVTNALTYHTEHAGDLTLIGPGAGGEQTASAIIRDLVELRQTYSE